MARPVPHTTDEPGWPWMDADRLAELLDGEGLTVAEAAERLGCHADTCRKWARRHGVIPDD